MRVRRSACRPLPETATPTQLTSPSAVDAADAEMIRAAVIWRDDHIIALNKPPGLATQGGSKQQRHVDGLAEALKFGLDEKPRLVHRLDKDTSGVLLLARTRAVAAKARGSLPVPRGPQDLLGGRGRHPEAEDGHDPLRPREGRRAGREDALPSRPTPWPPRPARGARRPTTPSSPTSAGGSPGSRWCRSPAARTSSGRTWPRSVTRSWATGNTAGRVRRTSATGGARASAGRSRESCTCTPARSG